jgi:hypothetical protein
MWNPDDPDKTRVHDDIKSRYLESKGGPLPLWEEPRDEVPEILGDFGSWRHFSSGNYELCGPTPTWQNPEISEVGEGG